MLVEEESEDYIDVEYLLKNIEELVLRGVIPTSMIKLILERNSDKI